MAEERSKQEMEVFLAKAFLEEIGHANAEPVALCDCSSAQAKYSTSELKNMMPDVVVASGDNLIGIELTAYSDDNLKNQQGAYQKRVRMAVRQIAAGYPSLQGGIVSYDSIETAMPHGKLSEFAVQLLDCADSLLSPHLVPGRTVSYPTSQQLAIKSPFARWPLLDKYVYQVSVTSSDGPLAWPVDGSTSFAHLYGTNVQKLAEIIQTKENKRRRKSYSDVSAIGLLIHAAREPMSSAITPLDAGEIRDLLVSPAATEAKASGFDRVILWDYVFGGYVDLKSGMHTTYRKAGAG